MIGLDLYSFRALWGHYRQCRRNKRNTANALAFEISAEANLLVLQAELRAHTYKPGRSICFITDGPKPREVFAADFRDRVVHHLLVSHQEHVFEPIFIHDSYACRKGKGALAASNRLMMFLRQITVNGKRPVWALKLDVADFFPSIKKAMLYDIISRRIRHPEVRWLTLTVLFHDPTTDYRFRSLSPQAHGPGSPLYPVPPYKSLFGKNNERGLPIGNLTSQFWGNVYLNELDQFIKRILKCRYYIRYVDDMILLDEDKMKLVRWCQAITEFLRQRLKLELRPEMSDPLAARKGIDFVGWKTWWNCRLPRRRTVENLRGKIEQFERKAVRPVWGRAGRWISLRRQDEGANVDELRSSLASYSGHLRHGAAQREWERIWHKHPWLARLFNREGWGLKERWPGHGMAFAPNIRSQYWPLARRAGDESLIFFQVGRFIEFYGPQRVLAVRVLGLRPVALPRAGYAFRAGFPAHMADLFAFRAVRVGLTVVEVPQVSLPFAEGPKARLPRAVFIPLE